jgi:hypothetical protein
MVVLTMIKLKFHICKHWTKNTKRQNYESLTKQKKGRNYAPRGVHTNPSFYLWLAPILSIGEGPEYKPSHDLRSMPQANRLREQVENRGRACT